MLPLFVLLAALGPVETPDAMSREINQGPTPFQERTLSQQHPNADDRMFPDIAVKDLRIDGDTLYVRLVNQGHSSAQAAILVAARAAANGVTGDLAQARVPRLRAGEARWVALKGLSIRTAAISPTIFALGGAVTVSAVARLAPAASGLPDRSGRDCSDCAADGDEANNVLTMNGDVIARGPPQ